MDNRYIRYKHSQKGGNIHKTTESKFFDDLFESNSGTEGNINEELGMVGGNDKFFNNLFSEDGYDMVGGGDMSDGNFFNDLFTEGELDEFVNEQNGGGIFDWFFGSDEEPKKEQTLEITDNVAKNL